MKLRTRSGTRRFSSPTLLQGDAPFLGATVEEWDKAITGGMDETLAQIKIRATGNGPKRDASKAVTSDLASFVARRLRNSK